MPAPPPRSTCAWVLLSSRTSCLWCIMMEIHRIYTVGDLEVLFYASRITRYITVAPVFLGLERLSNVTQNGPAYQADLSVCEGERGYACSVCCLSAAAVLHRSATLSLSHQIHAFTCAEKAMITSSRPSLTLEGPKGELSSHSSIKSGILSRRISLIRRTRRSMRTSLVDLFVGVHAK